MIKEKIDYVEQDIYDYFGADQEIHKASRHDLLGVIGGMSGILELLWHKEVTPEIAFKDFKSWLKERQEHDDLLDITEKIPDTNIPIKKEEEAHA
tara:strand:+ start:784 stop:1068 length:285 start_codon:yes stop_codon:yes gene_type:complete